ncbi:protein kinase (plasmid) [Acinetobacter sp. NCu2D-2]|uniref:bifunctional protein-serine/threonine kinase/phosphatase n=1 Tax=Acinetobacter sp. NCu2D-2 TaxID=1608473 RepID=UPI0007CDA76B|nr:bifunctional protein-serine/threonine kinase/phosphatase [Acinetobacter sp. NCu2D-2]ANF83433.1 protein kinase [Acinetobacter sp. NCu2D-2]
MKKQLEIRYGQYSSAGKKANNQDFYGLYIPEGHSLGAKGIACAIADGISSSNVSHIAAETAVSSFLSDYYSTSDAWSTQTSASRVIRATNSWLYAQTQQSQGRFDKDRGYVCTFSALILKQTQAHIFHVGDSCIYRIRCGEIEKLTTVHRVSISSNEHYLSRALGVDYKIEIDYQLLDLQLGDRFILMTDGIHEFIHTDSLNHLIDEEPNLDNVAKKIAQTALENGSADNLTIQIVEVTNLPLQLQFQPKNDYLFPDQLSRGEQFEGYIIEKILHQNHRSSLYLAHDIDGQNLVIKTLSVELQQDPLAIEQFQLEEWVSQRLKHKNLLQSNPHARGRAYLFQCYEYLNGVTLDRWLHSQKKPLLLDDILFITQQVANALNAMHRLEMLHQDVRPENVMIVENGKDLQVKLIDYGSTAVRGLVELNPKHQNVPLGTLAFMAPEYFIHQSPSTKSDQFSLAVLIYYLLSKQLPYGTALAACKNLKSLKRVEYHSILKYRNDMPKHLDQILAKALAIDPSQRFNHISEFIYALKERNDIQQTLSPMPIIKTKPVLFWKIATGSLFFISLFLLGILFK